MRTIFAAIGRKILTVTRLSARERRRALGTIVLMALVRTALWVLPFRQVRRLASAVGSSHWRHLGFGETDTRWAVRLAARYVPGASCLTQAITAQLLLSWSGTESRLHVGVSRLGKFEAHAWLECNGNILLGGEEESSRYSPILILEGRPARN
jgi:hypothetical protein